ncbi:cobalt-precorrin-5B (C(1))-methyltransferase CbiD [Arcobacter sp.]|uniref:cobalt-precorrin-5B (C(1))-methyltransferase CbiD n=1 Tax=unclassified Arcobacter TaxID=2593671 RepID=UPI003B00EE17
MGEKELRKGLTTGAHAFLLFCSALTDFLEREKLAICKINKMDNDDLDVTKGCEIVVCISDNFHELNLNNITHNPSVFLVNSNKLSIYAGEGVGVVTKKGLKIEPSFPAINPVPRDAIFKAFEELSSKYQNLDLKCTISVTDGEEISKRTANSKVGVLGGISILGTKGIVKPVSSSAYIDSVKTEIEFAIKNGYETLYFTLGNSALEVAKKYSNEEAIIEIGNFVFDSIEIAVKEGAKEVIFLCGIGKMTKVYQGFKNTHNRFGVIDFELLQKDIEEKLGFKVDIQSTLTVKGISQELEKYGLLVEFYKMITKKANEQIKHWHENSNVKAVILEQKDVLGW